MLQRSPTSLLSRAGWALAVVASTALLVLIAATVVHSRLWVLFWLGAAFIVVGVVKTFMGGKKRRSRFAVKAAAENSVDMSEAAATTKQSANGRLAFSTEAERVCLLNSWPNSLHGC